MFDILRHAVFISDKTSAHEQRRPEICSDSLQRSIKRQTRQPTHSLPRNQTTDDKTQRCTEMATPLLQGQQYVIARENATCLAKYPYK